MRIGIGYDIHRLVAGRDLVLGGVGISHEKGLLGHSDADVLLHAVCDALLGAAGLGDIGHYFPDSDLRYKGISSLLLLERVGETLSAGSWQVGNIDIVLIAERPRIAPYIDEMKANIARALGLPPSRIGLKATTNEGLGSIGSGEGIACYAVALIVEQEK
ncbi:MAG: 2-C-methyl-D-erythritol 2,4-cyclodiphosphate synthase [Armatimonadetes bacterium]|nr:2-C-methyl-D-erythritol 2,4-cyclodiphosphate synthase [Armatimonadota bacterium]